MKIRNISVSLQDSKVQEINRLTCCEISGQTFIIVLLNALKWKINKKTCSVLVYFNHKYYVLHNAEENIRTYKSK